MPRHAFLGAAASALLAVSISSPSLADGFDRRTVSYKGGSLKDAPAPVYMPFSWSGWYVGVHGGWAEGENDNDRNCPKHDYESYCYYYGHYYDHKSFGHSADFDGGFGGVQVGVNSQSGRLVAGIEVDIGYFDLDGSDKSSHYYYDENYDYKAHLHSDAELGWYGVLALRLGLAHGKALFYGKGGLAIAEIEAKGGASIYYADDDEWVKFHEGNGHSDDHEIGWVVGAGLEYAVKDNWTVKAEYLYFDFGGFDFQDDYGFHHDNDVELHTVKLGINYKFGHRETALPPLK